MATQDLTTIPKVESSSVGLFNTPTSVSDLGQQTPKVPQTPVATTPQTSYDNLAQAQLEELKTAENTQNTGNQLSVDIANLLPSLSGQATALSEAERQTGVQKFKEQLQGLNSQILMKTAEVNQDDIRLIAGLQTIEDKAIPMEFITGQQASLQQKANIARALKVSEIGILNAQVLAAQGNIALAQETAQKAVDAKYAPVKEAIQIKQSQLEVLKPLLDKAETQRATAQQNLYNLQLKRIDDAKAEQKQNIQTAQNYAKYALDAGQSELASQISSLNPTSPTFQKDLSNLQAQIKNPMLAFDLAIKAEQLKKIQKENQLLGEPTPAEKKAQEAAIKNAKASIPVMKNKIEAVELLKESDGLNSRVGTSILTRTPTGAFGTIGKVLTPGALGLVGDAADKFSGSGQSFAGGVHRLVSGLSLDSLIDAKARGATFGALSDSELNILANSASAINDWEIKDKNGVGLGVWNIDEKTFKSELNRIQELTRRALILSGEQTFSDDELNLIDSVYEDAESNNPANFY